MALTLQRKSSANPSAPESKDRRMNVVEFYASAHISGYNKVQTPAIQLQAFEPIGSINGLPIS